MILVDENGGELFSNLIIVKGGPDKTSYKSSSYFYLFPYRKSGALLLY